MLIVITVPIGAVQLARVRRHCFEDHLHTLHSLRLSTNFCLRLAIMPRFGQRFTYPTVAREDRGSPTFHLGPIVASAPQLDGEDPANLAPEALE
jgi:hypothetical protein